MTSAQIKLQDPPSICPRIHLKYWHVWQTDRGVALQLYGKGCRIGCVVEGHPHHTDHYKEIAWRCGYGLDVMWYAVEHDLFHAWVYEYLENTLSPVLSMLSAGRHLDPIMAAREEAWIQIIQAWVQGNVRPIIGGIDWDRLQIDAHSMLERFYAGGEK